MTTSEERKANKALLNLETDFDLEALRAKYRHERDKRIRKDGLKQYISVTGDFSHYGEDPYVEPGFEREPVTEDVDAVIVGGGFGGLLIASRLRQAGFPNIKIIEKAGDFGGVWYWNRYPGAQCDTDSNIYLPLLEETGYVAPRIRVTGDAIRAHARRIGETFDLYRSALFQTAITGQTWLEDEARWEITTDRGDCLKARFVIASSGPMQLPKLPGIPGITEFEGHSFHTSRWDYDYSGGDASGGLTGLEDKKVAVIGTGCTSIQCVPPLAKYAKHLYVVQRTPITIIPLINTPVEDAWRKSLSTGWQKRRNESFAGVVQGGLQIGGIGDRVEDAWTKAFNELGGIPAGMRPDDFEPEDLELAQELADHRLLNEMRRHIEKTVKDKETAEALKPWYRFMCKRPGFVDGYLECFNQPNVTLLDTEGQGVERVTPKGIVVKGVEYEVDCLIFATGFEVGTSYVQRIGYDIRGRGGKLLSDVWADGPRTLHGLYSHDFPNFFHMGPVQGGISTNIPHLLEEQATHIAEMLKVLRSRQVRTFEPSAAAEEAWIDTIITRGQKQLKYREACTPGYFNTEGEHNKHGLVENVYVGGPLEFYQLISDWRNSGDFEGIEFEYYDAFEAA